MKIGFAQINTTVGDLEGNAAKILAAYQNLSKLGAEIVLTPELALTGYPPQDLLFKSQFVPRNLEALEKITTHVDNAALIVGFVSLNPSAAGRPFRNSAAVMEKGKPVRVIHKSLLPTYDVFDEARYFEPGTENLPVEIAGRLYGITICEDIWTTEHLPRPLYSHDPLAQLAGHHPAAILNLSASPFQIGKPTLRQTMISALSKKLGVPFAYCNAVGGNDQLVFDGNSLAVGPDGVIWQGASFCEQEAVVDLGDGPVPLGEPRESMQDLHDALILGLRDYLKKCGFERCVLGLSGGIDSALTATLAVRAIGAENVTGVLMPSQYSSPHSIEDALELAENLGIKTLTIPIQPAFEAMKAQMKEAFDGLPEDATEENFQARLRGMTLMALSNKCGSLLLTTGNKSELAVGYCTLYGDMCGGLAVISDVPKIMVYELCDWINAQAGPIIPPNTILKPPSAELRPDQKDQDTLPPYDILDGILKLSVEENLSRAEIKARGFDSDVVDWVVRRVDLNEYKREQAAPGLKVTGRAFGMGRRMPLAQRFYH
ncbi:MAG: NAD+ synthase [Terrimicrobiaceae bacterium]